MVKSKNAGVEDKYREGIKSPITGYYLEPYTAGRDRESLVFSEPTNEMEKEINNKFFQNYSFVDIKKIRTSSVTDFSDPYIYENSQRFMDMLKANYKTGNIFYPKQEQKDKQENNVLFYVVTDADGIILLKRPVVVKKEIWEEIKK